MIRTDATARRAAKHERYLREIRERNAMAQPEPVGWLKATAMVLSELGGGGPSKPPRPNLDDAKIVDLIARAVLKKLRAERVVR